jgi:tetratricopeptide (TPR) repeat protein
MFPYEAGFEISTGSTPMAPDVANIVRTAKRLSEATGYFELGMFEHALRCLDRVASNGPFEAEIAMLRGEALRLQHRFKDAAQSLCIAANKFPAPLDRSAWYALSLVYRQTGDALKAIQMLGRARGAQTPLVNPWSM